MTLETIHKIFTHIPTLETERLQMRCILPKDAKDMYEYSCDPSVTLYLLWEEHPHLLHTEQYIDYLQERYAVGDFYDWALIHKETGKMIGSCGFTSFDAVNNCAEIGYVLNPVYRGCGYAPEAVKRILQFAFEELKLVRVSAVCMKENAASRRVMEKSGLKGEGILRRAVFSKGKYRDVFVAAITDEDYFHQ